MIKTKSICRASYVPRNLVRPLEHLTVIHIMITCLADEAASSLGTSSLQMSWLSTSFTDGICIVQRV
jgi:hypothetical protein